MTFDDLKKYINDIDNDINRSLVIVVLYLASVILDNAKKTISKEIEVKDNEI